MKKLLYYLLTSLIIFTFYSCSPYASGPEDEVRISFTMDNNPPSTKFLSKLYVPNNILQNRGLQINLAVDEIKILCLDMTKFSSEQEFFDFWDQTSQVDLIDFSLADTTKDLWDNLLLLFKSYTGDSYEYIGSYNLFFNDSIASTTVSLNPGLNYILYAGRINGETKHMGEVFTNISRDSVNVLQLHFGEEYNSPPYVPHTPTPFNAQTNVPPQQVSLSWYGEDPEDDPLTYDIYFGQSQLPPLAVVNHSTSQYTVPSLNPNTTYYWKIVARDDYGNVNTGSPVWRFTTGQ